MTAADGSMLMLTPDRLEGSSLEFTIPRTTAPGNYDVRAVKEGARSNLTVISVRPEVSLFKAALAFLPLAAGTSAFKLFNTLAHIASQHRLQGSRKSSAPASH